jgi:hypothetical protein
MFCRIKRRQLPECVHPGNGNEPVLFDQVDMRVPAEESKLRDHQLALELRYQQGPENQRIKSS